MKIEHIDDVLPLIDGRKDFVVKRDPLYTAVDYSIALYDTFDVPERIELRGVKFYPDGPIMARPLHKFFNLGERADLQVLSLDAEHTIMDKLDGSMVHAARLRDGSVRLMTRMGITSVAEKAERHLTSPMRRVLGEMLDDGITPIFEFTAPDNRIVVRYAESELTLLAARDTITGRYFSRLYLAEVARDLMVGLVRSWPAPRSPNDLVETVRALKGAEGVVIRFEEGPWLKIKGEEYALMHKAKDSITREKNVLATILDGLADDLRPLLSPEDCAAFDKYDRALAGSIASLSARVEAVVESGAAFDQKDFAVLHLAGQPQWMRSLAFTVRAGRTSAFEAVRAYMRKHCGSQADVDLLRPLLGFDWNGPVMEE